MAKRKFRLNWLNALAIGLLIVTLVFAFAGQYAAPAKKAVTTSGKITLEVTPRPVIVNGEVTFTIVKPNNSGGEVNG